MQRFYLLVSLILIFSFILIFKLIHIQFYENEIGLGIEPESIVKNVILEPSRGNIYASEILFESKVLIKVIFLRQLQKLFHPHT